jgi:hypothetical protein
MGTKSLPKIKAEHKAQQEGIDAAKKVDAQKSQAAAKV